MNTTPDINVKKSIMVTIAALILSFAVGWVTVQLGVMAFLISVFSVAGLIFLFASVKNPRISFIFYIIYCFLLSGLLKNNPQLPLGPLMEVLLGITWLSIIINANKYNWKTLNNQHVLIALAWFVINILELFNPADFSFLGWLNEIRFTALNWLLIAPIAFLIFNSKKDLNVFLIVIIATSVFTALYGAKQLHFGVSEQEQRWLNEGADFTHIVFGKLRVFSTYTDAGQFGASEAHLGLVALVLAFGPFAWWKRVLLGIASIIMFYGMLISGTRGALFALVAGAFFAIYLTKNFKILIIGTIFSLAFLAFLKYSSYGNQYYEINRLRTALDPKDASLNARFINQAKLREIMPNYPFGGGVGVSGINGDTYNQGNYLASIPPDSYWVKVWVMYGIIGLIIWFSMIMFLLGKCCGIVWKIQDKGLKIKMIALTAGNAGLFFCSYGNEVMNGFPSSVILYMAWSFVFLAPKLDKPGITETTYV